MNPQICTFFLVITSVFNSVCQISFDFEDSNFTLKEAWSGDLDRFLVKDGKLYLNDSTAGSSVLHTTYVFNGTIEMSILVGLEFEPSAQNGLVIYLWKRSIEDELSDALYIVIGESGDNDAIELYQRVNGEEILLGRGTNGSFSNSNNVVRLKVEIAEQMLLLSADYNGGLFTRQEILTEFDNEIRGEGFFALKCFYTSSRADRFNFDELYIGEVRVDSTAPMIIENKFESQSIRLSIDEVLQPEQIVTNAFTVLPIDISPSGVIYDPIQNIISMDFANPLPEQTELSLNISGLIDLAGNRLDTIIDFIIASSPSSGELVINEVLFNPRADGADFIELYNSTGTWLSLDGLSIINDNNGDSFTFSDGVLIGPFEYILLTSDRDKVIRDYPAHDREVMYTIDLPRLNNDNGNITLLLGDSEIIDKFDYDEDYHFSIIDDVEGVSLERVAIEGRTNEPSNWTSASAAIGYGTPGIANSARIDNISEIDIEISSKIISPNGDQIDDVLLIKYSLDKSDYLSTVTIYSDRGEQVAVIANNQISGSQGMWQWEGIADSNQEVVNSGIYVVLIDLLSLSGHRERIKKTIVVADFID